ncbi:hypothetical protein K2X89_14335 [Myxococcota bacterium]|nr:hypothetical protein [Myxococcota bacterium]
MQRMEWTRAIGFSLAIASFGLVGCASNADVDRLAKRLDAMEAEDRTDHARFDGLERSIEALQAELAETRGVAERAREQAGAAQNAAEAAAGRADDAARRADAMFKKTVSK